MDRNGNSQWDSDEPALPGYHLWLVACNSNWSQAIVSGAGGAYRFVEVPSGWYELSSPTDAHAYSSESVAIYVPGGQPIQYNFTALLTQHGWIPTVLTDAN